MIETNIKRLHARLPSHVVLVAVSKFQSAALIRRAYDAGQRVFGETGRVSCWKIPLLPKDIQWHFIGHLQTNKVKEVVGHVSLIQSVDRDRLLHAIQVQAEKWGLSRMCSCRCILHRKKQNTVICRKRYCKCIKTGGPM